MLYKVPTFDNAWASLMEAEFKKDYFHAILDFLNAKKVSETIIYPEVESTYAAFKRLDPSEVKVVLLGQDPYHGPGQAQGLSFSVPKSHKVPPSLRNVYKELKATIDMFIIPKHGNLESWADQGVLLLNSVLTVENGFPGSHSGKGWEIFTDYILKLISTNKFIHIYIWETLGSL